MKIVARLLLFFLPVGFVEALWLINQQSFSIAQAAGVLLVTLNALTLPEVFWIKGGARKNRFVKLAALLLLLPGGALFFFKADGAAGAGTFLAFSLFASLSLLLIEILTRKVHPILYWVFSAALALLFGAVTLGTLQVMERFSEEEFFAAVQWIFVSGWFFLLCAAWRGIFYPGSRLERFSHHPLRPALFVFLVVSLTIAVPLMLKQYQESFYPAQASAYPGISAEQPFLCGQASQEGNAAAYDSGQVFQGIIEQAAANPTKTVTLLGMLSLSSVDNQWKEAFRQGLLKEARQGIYTGPAGSVKFGQYETALRAYYFHEVSQQTPDLFTEKEKQEILGWFAAVNRRSMTVEWVDWMYAAAFGEWPKGPYLNQENGASLLALLETYGYADPQQKERNQTYLAEYNQGWNQRFRNSDDSIYYQALWINNALFQSLFTGILQQERIQRSFEWMLLQAPPDGSPFGYNPTLVSLTAPAYLGAQLTGDGRYLWLAGRALEYLQSHHLPLYTQPGLKGAINMASVQPEVGSCLVFGDSGTPVRLGPLAPDKIVFRDGWNPGDRYLNLNLRFTGWHRYKATNSIISVYQEEPLIIERLDNPASNWLPIGRSVFRDKRIPRENLNGLIVPRQGLSKLIFWLTGFGSPWAQDPPFYVTVEQFQTSPEMDVSATRMEWNGWKQVRSIYFVHDGPTIVVDEAAGPLGQTAGVTWHAVVQSAFEGGIEDAIPLGTKGNVEMRLVEIGKGNLAYENEQNGKQQWLKLLYTGKSGGVLRLCTVFLDGEWRKAEILEEGQFLLIRHAGRSVRIPFPGVN